MFGHFISYINHNLRKVRSICSLKVSNAFESLNGVQLALELEKHHLDFGSGVEVPSNVAKIAF